jgi:DNA modification methylase
MTWTVLHSECVEAMAAMEPSSVDAIVTDPPYELGFMGKKWDASGIAYSVDLWRAALRVLKPGGHLLAFGGTRTYHRMTCAIEDAGFEIRDSLHWIYGSGFPKSLDVSKAIDAHLGAERPVVGERVDGCAPSNGNATTISGARVRSYPVTAPATAWATAWDGWGTALKPAHEPIVLARKPLIGTVAANVLEHGTGGLNIDACRVGDTVESWPSSRSYAPGQIQPGGVGATQATGDAPPGRWPPNLLFSHDPACDGQCAPGCPVAELDRQSGETGQQGDVTGREPSAKTDNILCAYAERHPAAARGDSGGASRFFPVFRYVAKPARSERDAGLHDLEAVSGNDVTGREPDSVGAKSPRAGTTQAARRNIHPTVKPVALMEWLVQLVTPRGGTVLDPFLGSGSTGCAAVRLGFSFVGIEREAEYVALAERRIRLAASAPRSTPLGSLERGPEADPRQLGLFDASSG